jgi:hypothetical protein
MEKDFNKIQLTVRLNLRLPMVCLSAFTEMPRMSLVLGRKKCDIANGVYLVFGVVLLFSSTSFLISVYRMSWIFHIYINRKSKTYLYFLTSLFSWYPFRGI